MKPERKNPKRGEIWYYHPGRTIGSEMTKKRRAVVVSSNAMGILPMKLVVPLTEWDEKYADNEWHVKIVRDPMNCLTKDSAADILQMRSISLERFDIKVGVVSATLMEEIATAIAIVVEAQ